jgi:hypothetical protein
MKNDHAEAEYRQGVGWCFEILPPHYSRDETLHHGPNPPHVPLAPDNAPHPASCQCGGGYCVVRALLAERSR